MTQIIFPKHSPLARVCAACNYGREIQGGRETRVFQCNNNPHRCLANLEATIKEEEKRTEKELEGYLDKQAALKILLLGGVDPKVLASQHNFSLEEIQAAQRWLQLHPAARK